MSKQLFYNQLAMQERELLEALKAVRALMKHYEGDVTNSQPSFDFKEAEISEVVNCSLK